MSSKILWREPSVENEYKAWLACYDGECTFCDQANNRASDQDMVDEWHTYFLTTKNRFPYATWDNLAISKHLMLIPKRHVTSLDQMSADETAEFIRLLARYEAGGFSIYIRSHDSTSRTIPHVHIHLFAGEPV